MTYVAQHPDLDLRGVGSQPMTMEWVIDRLHDRQLAGHEPLRILLDRGQAADLNIEVRMAGTPTKIQGIETVVYG